MIDLGQICNLVNRKLHDMERIGMIGTGRYTVFKFTRNKQRKIAKAHTVHFQT